jgi:hypothetical protein
MHVPVLSKLGLRSKKKKNKKKKKIKKIKKKKKKGKNKHEASSRQDRDGGPLLL